MKVIYRAEEIQCENGKRKNTVFSKTLFEFYFVLFLNRKKINNILGSPLCADRNKNETKLNVSAGSCRSYTKGYDRTDRC